MNKFLCISLFIFAFIALSLNQVVITTEIDQFTEITPTIVLIIPSGGAPPTVEDTAFTVDSSILGGERDLLLRAESGPENRVLTSGVADGSWSVATPNSASGFAVMQYDGTDGDINLNPSGLGGQNLLANNGEFFRLVIESDLPTTYTITVYSGSENASCEANASTNGGNIEENVDLSFNSFTSGCDFSNVGAVEIFVEQFDNVDAICSLFAIFGEPDPTPSNTPSTAPTSSGTPTPTPCQQVCECPAFTCSLVFGDDDYQDPYYLDDAYLDVYTFVDDDTSGGVVVRIGVDDDGCVDPFDYDDDDGCDHDDEDEDDNNESRNGDDDNQGDNACDDAEEDERCVADLFDDDTDDDNDGDDDNQDNIYNGDIGDDDSHASLLTISFAFFVVIIAFALF